jgi:hypothetical protein
MVDYLKAAVVESFNRKIQESVPVHDLAIFPTYYDACPQHGIGIGKSIATATVELLFHPAISQLRERIQVLTARYPDFAVDMASILLDDDVITISDCTRCARVVTMLREDLYSLAEHASLYCAFCDAQ